MAQPEQNVREMPVAEERWTEEATAFFAANVPQAEDSGPIVNEPSASLAVDAMVALAGFVAVAGDQRRSEKRAWKANKKRIG
jgi:hypothetical protein